MKLSKDKYYKLFEEKIISIFLFLIAKPDEVTEIKIKINNKQMKLKLPNFIKNRLDNFISDEDFFLESLKMV